MAEPKKRQLPADQRQQQILQAALAVFSGKGFSRATVPDIAAEAGVAVGTIYNYYPSKRELFIAVIKNMIITSPLLDLIASFPQRDAGVTLKDILQDRLKLISSPAMARMPSLMGEVQRDPELSKIWSQQFLQPFLAQLDGIYLTMVASGKFRSLEPTITVRAVGGLIIGLVILKLMEGESSPLNRLPQREIIDEVTTFILYGLQGKANDNGKESI
jgi:AcrR family transcriptional regulator